jgi:hypothetical protein
MINSSNTYIDCKYLYNNNNTDTSEIKSNLFINNIIYSSNILLNISNIYGNFLDNYSNIYAELNVVNNYNGILVLLLGFGFSSIVVHLANSKSHSLNKIFYFGLLILSAIFSLIKYNFNT